MASPCDGARGPSDLPHGPPASQCPQPATEHTAVPREGGLAISELLPKGYIQVNPHTMAPNHHGPWGRYAVTGPHCESEMEEMVKTSFLEVR